MGISVYEKSDQASGSFNQGEILEKKPIGFPQDGGRLKPLLKYILLGSCVDT